MEVFIVTGTSGSGKTKCLKILEDFGFLCVDNIMPGLIAAVVETCDSVHATAPVERLAVSVDVRGGVFFEGIYSALDELNADGYSPHLLFLDADDETICNRFKESRREHPLSVGGRVVTGIRKERELLEKLRGMSDYYIDTSHLSHNELRQSLYTLLRGQRQNTPAVFLLSFGEKRGLPGDCDMIYDVRYLPNPFHEPSLRERNGTHKDVVSFVFSSPLAEVSLQGLARQIELILPSFLSTVKSSLVIGIGCTGGKHRSVACAERLGEILTEKNILVRIEHRDLYKE